MRSIKRGRCCPANIYIIFPFIFVLFPIFPTTFQGNRGIQIVFALELVLLVLCGLLGVYKSGFSTKSLFCFFFFLLSTFFSVLCDLFSGVFIISDLYEIAKPFAFLLFFIFYRKANVDIDVLEKSTIKSILIIFFLLSIYCISEFIFPEIIRPWSYLLYKKESVPILRGMAIGSFEITYNFAFVLLLPLIYSIISLLIEFNIKYFVMFILFLFTFLLTQSRSMYITFAAALFLVFFLPLLYSKTRMAVRVILIIIIFSVITVSIYIRYYDDLKTTFGYAIGGLESMTVGENQSVNNREGQIQWVIENNKFILIGAGIGKNVRMLESFYSLYYYRYGLLGILLYLTIPVVTALTSYRIAKKEFKVNKQLAAFYLGLFVYYAVSPIGLLSSCNQDTPKTAFLFYGFIGFVFHKYGVIKKQEF
jgi:hypothetical protein